MILFLRGKKSLGGEICIAIGFVFLFFILMSDNTGFKLDYTCDSARAEKLCVGFW